jgi:hypothetical protein
MGILDRLRHAQAPGTHDQHRLLQELRGGTKALATVTRRRDTGLSSRSSRSDQHFWDVWLDFEVDGRTYEVEHRLHVSAGLPEVGEQRWVWYDPADPSRAVMEVHRPRTPEEQAAKARAVAQGEVLRATLAAGPTAPDPAAFEALHERRAVASSTTSPTRPSSCASWAARSHAGRFRASTDDARTAEVDGAPMHRPSPSTAIASLALFLSVTGAAYAGAVMNNSVASPSIVNGSIKPVDLAPSADPAATWFGVNTEEQAIDALDLPATRVTVPAGRYLLQAAVDVAVPNGTESQVTCRLQDGAGAGAPTLDVAYDHRRTPATLPAVPQRMTITLNAVTKGETGAGDFVVVCSSPLKDAKITDARIAATVVRGLTVQNVKG